jgi:ribulose bisphosphate carboxylase small subunit
MRKLTNLSGCGIMVNYRCTAACRHCLYSCSPTRSGGYIGCETVENVARLLRQGGCRSVHIGGGEPFLDFDKLLAVLAVLNDAGISVDYIETNAYWADDGVEVKHHLQALRTAGADTLCISVDPYHAEYVAPAKPLFLAKCCRDAGFGYFLWQERFLSMMNVDTRESRASMEKLIAPDYIWQTAKVYGLSMGGRAINIEEEYLPKKPAASLLDETPCRRLLNAGHFHVDLYGRYIPPGCTGIAIPFNEVVEGIPDKKYPVLEALIENGITGLVDYVIDKGFTINSEYTSKCALCFHLRHWLSANAPSAELDAEHYSESLMYYYRQCTHRNKNTCQALFLASVSIHDLTREKTK